MRQAAEIAARSARAAGVSASRRRESQGRPLDRPGQHPRRRAPLPRQAFFALVTIALDGVACYFAAQALNGSQDSTLVWTAMFLAVLAAR